MTPTLDLPAHLANPVLHLPTRSEVLNLRPGDLALDCFGRWARVVSIHARRDDVHGRAFACFYLEFGPRGSTISGSMKEGELVRTVALTRLYNSAELDAIERQLRSEQRS
jgi:hypothetical protein